MTKGRQTKLSYCDTIDGTYTPLAKLVDVTPPKISVDEIDVTHMESPDDYREKEAGWKEAGDIDCKIQFEKTQAAALIALVGVSKFWKVEFADGSTWKASGFIKELGDEVDLKDKVIQSIRIAVSGKPTFTAAA